MQYELSISDYISIAKRRLWYFILPFVAIVLISGVVVMLLPAVYQATGKILVESQQIPTDLVRSTVTGFAEERIQIIHQRVMTRSNLLRVIDKFNIFSDSSQQLSKSEQVADMRSNINVSLESVGERKRRQASSTIAFSVAYKDANPEQALRVANELVTLFLDENVRARTERASETTEFLEEQAEKLRQDLEALENRIAQYKAENSDALPEQLKMHLNMLERSEAELKRLDSDKRALEEELRFLKIELTGITSGVGVSKADMSSMSPSQQLSAARSELVALEARYADKHPDVIATKERIASLEANIASESPASQSKTDLAAAEARLSALMGSYGKDHPEVVKARGEVATLKKKVAALDAKAAENGDGETEFDLATARLNGQIAAAEARIGVLENVGAEVRSRIADLQARVIRTPEVERGLTALSRDYENSRAKYEEIKSKQIEAQLAQNLEEGKKAERFQLLEPPVLPEQPTSPNRPKLLAVSFAGAAAVSIGLVVLIEMLFGGITSPAVLTQIMRQPPLAVIPRIKTKAEVLKRKRQLFIAAASAPTMTIVALIAVHYLYMPLDVIAFKAMAKF